MIPRGEEDEEEKKLTATAHNVGRQIDTTRRLAKPQQEEEEEEEEEEERLDITKSKRHRRRRRQRFHLMAAPPRFPFPFLLLLVLSLSLPVPSPAADDEDMGPAEVEALLALKSALVHPAGADALLPSWANGSTPCGSRRQWQRVVCYHGSVSSLRLGGMGLSGSVNVDSLARLRWLRSISLNDNSFSGTIPDFARLHALKSIYLSGNRFTGAIPDDFFSRMSHMKKVWLSGNDFEGPIPSSISRLSFLMELRLEDNRFAGAIPDAALPALKSFNVSNNRLEGPVPGSFARFGPGSFTGNAGLCGPPLPPCGAPTPPPPSLGEAGGGGSGSRSGMTMVVCLVVVGLLLVAVSVAAVAKRNREGGFQTLGVEQPRVGGGVEVAVPAAAAAAAAAAEEEESASSRGKRQQQKQGAGSAHGGKGGKKGAVAELVMVNDEKGVFGLPDLMKAAAEVLGNGGLGSAYKAVMASGAAVVVKRMKEMNRLSKDVFDMEMRRLGRLRHPNVLTPLAYHYRKEEKLLVFEHIDRGTLLYILHGDRGPYHAALDWPTRLRIICGIARGMAYLHAELSDIELPHGNLKSGNVLLGREFEALIMDFGYTPLVNPSQASQVMFAYRSPEFVHYRHVSAKSDVYCLGVLILELLTGKFPSQYLNNGKGGTDVIQWVSAAVAERREAEVVDPEITGSEKAATGGMERLLRLGVALTEPNPEKRPDMKEAERRIEEIVADPEKVEEQQLPLVSVSPADLVADMTGRLSGRVATVDQPPPPVDDNLEVGIS